MSLLICTVLPHFWEILSSGKHLTRRDDLLAPEVVQAAREFVFDVGRSASRRLELALGNERFMADWGQDSGYLSLLDYFPNQYAARTSFATLVADCRETFSDAEEDAGVPPLLSELTEDELNRRRFAHGWQPRGDFCRLGPRWGRGLSLYLDVLPKPVGAWLSRLLKHLGLFRSQSSSAIARGLKKLSDVMKKQGNLISEFWRYAVNLETLGGYRPSLPMSTFIPELRSWATGSVFHGYPQGGSLSESAFLEHFRRGVKTFLNDAPSVVRANEKALTLDQFVSDPANWGNDGSTHFKSTVSVTLDGEGQKKLKRNKFTTSLLLPPAQVKRFILDPHVQRLRPIEKLESGKVRAVVNADDVTYMKMAFVSNWLERALDRHPRSTLFMTTRQRAEMWQRLGLRTRLDTTKIPLDQSHFDWQPNKAMIGAVIDEIRDFICANCTVDLENMLSVVDSIKHTLVETVGVIEVKEQGVETKIPVEKGVMSGWRWTALIDTLCNVGELSAAVDLCADWGLGGAVIDYVAQGDDDQVSCPSFAHAAALAEAYRVMGFEINPGKFFIDTSRDEFLRLVPLPDKVIGYPARAVNNILWRNPINPDPLPGEVSIKAQLAQWVLLINRGCDAGRCLQHMLADMVGRNQIAREDIISYLVTPAPYGGCGLVGTHFSASHWTTISQSRLDTPFSFDSSSFLGLSKVFDASKKLGLPEEVVVKAVRSRLPLGNIRGRVTPPEVKAVSLERTGIATPVAPTERNVPRAYVMTDSVPLLVRGEYIEYLVREWDLPALERLCDPDVLPWFVKFKHCMSRSCFRQWLLGRLDLQAPVILGYGVEQSSVMWHALVNSILASCTTRMRVTVNYFRAAATAAVGRLQSLLAKVLPVSG